MKLWSTSQGLLITLTHNAGRPRSEPVADQSKRVQRGTQPVIAGVPPGQPSVPQAQFSAAAAAASGQPQQGTTRLHTALTCCYQHALPHERARAEHVNLCALAATVVTCNAGTLGFQLGRPSAEGQEAAASANTSLPSQVRPSLLASVPLRNRVVSDCCRRNFIYRPDELRLRHAG